MECLHIQTGVLNMTNKELFKMFRKSNEPSFINFLEQLGEINVEKNPTNTNRPKRQNNRQFNRRQEQTLQTINENRRNSKKFESTEKVTKISIKVPRGEV